MKSFFICLMTHFPILNRIDLIVYVYTVYSGPKTFFEAIFKEGMI